MASEAEVDLIISTADTLPDLERDLQRIIRVAEDGAETLDVEAALAVGESISNLAEEIERVVSAAEADASDIELEAALDAGRSLSQIQAQLESLVQRAEQGDEIELRAELDAIGSLQEVEGQLRALVATAEADAPEIEIEVDIDRSGNAQRSALNLGKAFSKVIGPLGKVTAGIGAAGLAAGSAVPLLAGVATAIESIAPAAAVATTGMLSLALVSGTVKLAMQGVSEAIATAFDPEAKPEELAKAMEKLAPNARDFVTELRSMRGAFKELQQNVQEEFFDGFDDALISLSTDVLPQFETALFGTAATLNMMALGAAASAIELGSNGTLQKALLSATEGLANFTKVPGQAVTALGQLAAAAGPSFERVTAAAAASATKISERLGKAFESGALEEAIDGAVDAVAQLGRIFGNVFEGIGNILSTVNSQGESLFSTMEKVTQAFADVTASKGFQQALSALVETAGVLVSTVLPLISQALQTLGPVFQALAAPVQILVRALGEGIGRVLTALEPVLVSVANAFGQLVLVITPFINLAAGLIAALLPGLIPLFDGLGQALNAMIPFAEALATALSTALVPLFTKIATEVLPQLLPPLVELASKIFPVLTEVITGLTPILVQIATVFGEVLVAVTPLLVELINLALALADELQPVLGPVLDAVIGLTQLGFEVLAGVITGVVIPIIGILVDLLRGDFSAAWEATKEVVRNVASKIGDLISRMNERIVQLLGELKDLALAKIRELGEGMRKDVDGALGRVKDLFTKLPGQILSALGDLGTLLLSAGADLVRGLINGIQSQLGALRDAASKVADAVSGSVKGLLGISSPSKVMMEVGKDTMDGFRLGIAGEVPDLRSQLQGIASLAPSFALPDGRTLQLPQVSQGAPTVQVYLGNELINGHVDARIATSNQARDLLMTQGVRR